MVVSGFEQTRDGWWWWWWGGQRQGQRQIGVESVAKARISFGAAAAWTRAVTVRAVAAERVWRSREREAKEPSHLNNLNHHHPSCHQEMESYTPNITSLPPNP